MTNQTQPLSREESNLLFKYKMLTPSDRKLLTSLLERFFALHAYSVSMEQTLASSGMVDRAA